MMLELEAQACIYQDDVVDFLCRNNQEDLLRENSQGNLVLGNQIISDFKRKTGSSVVWVKPDRYWRYRTDEDEATREARG